MSNTTAIYKSQYFTCKKCRERKIWGEFCKNWKSHSGRSSICKKCFSAHIIAGRKKKNKESYYMRNRDSIVAKRKIRYALIKGNLEEYNKMRLEQKERTFKSKQTRKVYLKKYNEINRIELLKKSKIRSKLVVENLEDYYIIGQLRRKGFSHEQILSNTYLIEFQRTLILTKRLCKTLKN